MVGIGFFQCQEFLGTINIKCSSNTTYQKAHRKVELFIKHAALESHERGAAVERRVARTKGNVVCDIPVIVTETDGSYGKRSFIHSRHDSSCCCVAIMGRETNKVIQQVIKQKTCATCRIAESRGVSRVKEHICSRNHGKNLSSTSMESDGVVEAFVNSVERNRCIYGTMISDGDASNYFKVLAANPYGEYNVQVKNILCVQHLKRNLATNAKELASSIKGRELSGVKRKLLQRIVPMRDLLTNASEKAIELSVPFQDKVTQLRCSIQALKYHILGKHDFCENVLYKCNGSHDDKQKNDNIYNLMFDHGIFHKFAAIIQRIYNNADSLIHNLTTNNVESFNNLIAKCIGGKRIMFSWGFSYAARCYLSSVQHNEGTNLAYICKSGRKNIPIVGFQVQNARMRARLLKKIRNRENKGNPKPTKPRMSQDKDYGLFAEQPDMDSTQMQIAIEAHYDKLRRYQEQRISIEENTRSQDPYGQWMSIRKDCITASNAYLIVRRRADTSCAGIIKKILYSNVIKTAATIHGHENEKLTKEKLRQKGYDIIDGGIFMDPVNLGIAASPDFIVTKDGITRLGEVKSPFIGKNLPVLEALKLPKGTFPSEFEWIDPNPVDVNLLQKNSREEKAGKKKRDKTEEEKAEENARLTQPVLKTKGGSIYPQLQLQLHCTGLDEAMLVISTEIEMMIMIIKRNDQYLENMIRKLNQFYAEAMVPEIIDSRYLRKMEIREPQFIRDAQEKKKTTTKATAKKAVEKAISSSNITASEIFQDFPLNGATAEEREYLQEALRESYQDPNVMERVDEAYDDFLASLAFDEDDNPMYSIYDGWLCDDKLSDVDEESLCDDLDDDFFNCMYENQYRYEVDGQDEQLYEEEV